MYGELWCYNLILYVTCLELKFPPFMRELSPSQGTRPLSPKTEKNTDMILIAILFFISILVLGTGTRKGMKRKWASEENICFMNFFRDELREKINSR